jgi:hypothetical protein
MKLIRNISEHTNGTTRTSSVWDKIKSDVVI